MTDAGLGSVAGGGAVTIIRDLNRGLSLVPSAHVVAARSARASKRSETQGVDRSPDGEQSGAEDLVCGAVDGCPSHGDGSIPQGVIGRRGGAVGGELGLVVDGRE
jgi:hypothetical protein